MSEQKEGSPVSGRYKSTSTDCMMNLLILQAPEEANDGDMIDQG
jgi:hypothetical protein